MTSAKYDEIAEWYDESVRRKTLFILDRFAEPQATGYIADRIPGYREIPAVLVVRCRK
jgi:hypothetical protein